MGDSTAPKADPLLRAIKQHDLEELVQALSSGADPNATLDEMNGWRPLHAAVDALEHGGSISMVVMLLRFGADVEAWDAQHTVNPLLMALFRDRHEALRLFLAAGANPNVVGDEGTSPCAGPSSVGTSTRRRCSCTAAPTRRSIWRGDFVA